MGKYKVAMKDWEKRGEAALLAVIPKEEKYVDRIFGERYMYVVTSELPQEEETEDLSEDTIDEEIGEEGESGNLSISINYDEELEEILSMNYRDVMDTIESKYIDGTLSIEQIKRLKELEKNGRNRKKSVLITIEAIILED